MVEITYFTLEVPNPKCTLAKRLGTKGKKNNSITGEKMELVSVQKQAVKEVSISTTAVANLVFSPLYIYISTSLYPKPLKTKTMFPLLKGIMCLRNFSANLSAENVQ
jgi:hypothetical protein